MPVKVEEEAMSDADFGIGHAPVKGDKKEEDFKMEMDTAAFPEHLCRKRTYHSEYSREEDSFFSWLKILPFVIWIPILNISLYQSIPGYSAGFSMISYFNIIIYPLSF